MEPLGSLGDNIVLISNRDRQIYIRAGILRHLTQIVLHLLNQKCIVLSLVFVPDHAIKRLNSRFLKHCWHTDVLAFSFSKSMCDLGKHRFLGELIISPKRAQMWSRRYETTFQEELMRYVCHGILHLFGFRDTTPRKRNQMRLEENRLLYLIGSDVHRIARNGHS